MPQGQSGIYTPETSSSQPDSRLPTRDSLVSLV